MSAIGLEGPSHFHICFLQCGPLMDGLIAKLTTNCALPCMHAASQWGSVVPPMQPGSLSQLRVGLAEEAGPAALLGSDQPALLLGRFLPSVPLRALVLLVSGPQFPHPCSGSPGSKSPSRFAELACRLLGLKAPEL